MPPPRMPEWASSRWASPARASMRTPLDPEGYYARLGVEPWSGPEAIHAAWRRAVRFVLPSVPGGGVAAGFKELKQAEDVLGQPLTGAPVDRAGRQAAPAEPET